MKYFEKNITNEEISLDDKKNQKMIEIQFYQDYLREQNIIETKDKKIKILSTNKKAGGNHE